MDDEPAENISGGDLGGGEFSAFDSRTERTRAEMIADRLGELYWQKTYGGQDAFECLVRTVLSQNTSDVASQPAHDALIKRYGRTETDTGSVEDVDLAESLADVHQDELAKTISSAGLYNQKSKTLIRLAGQIQEEYGDTDGFDEFVRTEESETVRERLLDMKGVGPKTADCVLLFAGGQSGVFPVDTHVYRIARRMGIARPDADHEEVRESLETNVPAEKCGFGHTAMIQFGREVCTARKPACLDGPEACPMYDLCDRVGINELDESVTDPGESVRN